MFNVCTLVLLGCVSAAASTSEEPHRYEYRKIVMGVQARIVLHAPTESAARHAAADAFAVLEGLDATLSDYRSDSELMRLCASAGGPPVTVGMDLHAVLRRAADISAASGGAFDVSIGPLVRLWRGARADGAPPASTLIDAARVSVNWEAIELRQDPVRTVRLARPGMQLDLGGIAKGYAADRALTTLRRKGFGRALVELGGDVVVGDPPPGRAFWFVQAGCGEGALPPPRLAVVNEAIAVSGDTAQHLLHAGVRYSHVIDPRTGAAMTDRLCCTVIAPDGATADALASAVRVLGAEQGQALVNAFGARLLVDGEPLLAGLGAGATGPWSDLLARGLEDWAVVGPTGTPLPADEYSVIDGVLAIPANAPSGTLSTRADYTDFHLRLDFKLSRMANGGLFLRAARDGSNPAYSGCEVQLLDEHNWEAVTDTTLRAWQFTGSLYGAMAPSRSGLLAPLDQWNSLELLYQGSRLAVALNGVLLYDLDTASLSVEPPFESRAPTGFIGLQRYASSNVEGETAVWVKNMLVREL
jgi:thiamine biosynthesis lipoprotein